MTDLSGEDREQGMRIWWGCMEQGGLDICDEIETRLFPTCCQVLRAIPADDFQTFMAIDARVILLPGSHGKVFEYEGGTTVTIIYFALNILRVKDHVDVVAHEVAHLVLGHQSVYEASNAESEAATDTMAEQWGFRRRYTRAALQEMKRRETTPRKRGPQSYRRQAMADERRRPETSEEKCPRCGSTDVAPTGFAHQAGLGNPEPPRVRLPRLRKAVRPHASSPLTVSLSGH